MELDQNKYIITQIQEHMDKLEEEHEHEKTSFWATEAETPVFDLYHKWIGTPPTNPIEAEKLMMFGAAKMMEESVIHTLAEMNLLEEIEEGQHRIEMEREGVLVTGYMDGLFKGNIPLEIKTYYGDYQLRDLDAGKPRPSYLKQLAVYMDFCNAVKGKLIYINRGTGQMHEFTLMRGSSSDTEYACVATRFDLNDVYSRWGKLHRLNIEPRLEPKSEYRYKIPVDKVDWKSVSKSNISKARNGKKVIGDHPWAIQYSAYKDLIIEREGCGLGYSDAELEKIKQLTKGYSTWGK